MMYTNFTFVGPVIEALYGDMGVFYFVVLCCHTVGLLQPCWSPLGLAQTQRTMKEKLKGWFSAPVVAVFVGLILYLSQLKLSAPITGVINSLGSWTSPLGMSLLVGLERELTQIVVTFAALPAASLLAAAVAIPLWASVLALCFS